MNQLIFCDFDGVIRHWDNQGLFKTERELKLQKGTTFNVAFAAEYLVPAITGKISDQVWRQNVYDQLALQHSPEQAKMLIDSWNHSPATISLELLDLFQTQLPDAKVALVTNATSRLEKDLINYNLVNRFDSIINSSAIGVAKPHHGFYMHALEATNARIESSIFIDDSVNNVLAAESFGLKGFHFQGAELLQKEINRWLTTK